LSLKWSRYQDPESRGHMDQNVKVSPPHASRTLLNSSAQVRVDREAGVLQETNRSDSEVKSQLPSPIVIVLC
jgi:hypothetical protein